MFVIDCLPLNKGLNKDSLSYFSSIFLEPGSLIKVNIRDKTTWALVLSNQNLNEAKLEVKSADFQLKKISSFVAKPFLEKEFLETAIENSQYFATSIGGLLSHLLPNFILTNTNLISNNKENNPSKELPAKLKKINKNEVSILQADEEERYDHYKSLIREEFAKNKSVFLCLPKNEDVKYAKSKIEKGIENFVFAFHKDLNLKNLKDEFRKVANTKHPIVLIATPSWLFFPRKDWGIVIIDKENDNGWKTVVRPFVDLRHFAENLAKNKKIPCIIGDTFLRIETLYRKQTGELEEFNRSNWYSQNKTTNLIVDLKKDFKKEKDFKIFSEPFLDLIRETQKKGSQLFIFAARKGIASTIICRDCGEQVKCFNCESPMILHKNKNDKEENIFKCHQCGETRDAAEICQNCKSWKLGAFGTGIDQVASEIKKNFPAINLFEINKDIAETSNKAFKIIKNFYETKGAILLGTEIAFSYLYKKVNYSAIASLDSLFAIPDFKIREKIFKNILQTKNVAREKFLIQTNNSTDKTINFAINNDFFEFYKSEIKDRKNLDYPPFSVFIKITVRGNKNFVNKEMVNLENLFKEENPDIFFSTHEKKGEISAANLVIKISKTDWPNQTILQKIKSLPPFFEIKIDPDSLL